MLWVWLTLQIRIENKKKSLSMLNTGREDKYLYSIFYQTILFAFETKIR